MKPTDPNPVKLMIGVLYSDADQLPCATSRLQEEYGAIDFCSDPFLFEITDYYNAEMGSPIFRLFYAFEHLINPGLLAPIKIACNKIEDDLTVLGQRKINLDPGYMDYDKIVLASAKYNAHKIYLDLGIYADLTLRYEKGHYIPSPWCFPDYKSPVYEEILLKIRARYKGQLRKLKK